jgi:histidine triad (HIT) family protein
VTSDTCAICDHVLPDEPLLAYADDTMVAFPPLQQRASNRGHVIVAPREHIPTLYELPDRLATDVITTVRHVALAVRDAFDADGTTIKQNNDPPGQDVFHLHVHVIPRYRRPDDLTGPWEELDREQQLTTVRRVRDALSGRRLPR